jgi:acylphosphatase
LTDCGFERGRVMNDVIQSLKTILAAEGVQATVRIESDGNVEVIVEGGDFQKAKKIAELHGGPAVWVGISDKWLKAVGAAISSKVLAAYEAAKHAAVSQHVKVEGTSCTFANGSKGHIGLWHDDQYIANMPSAGAAVDGVASRLIQAG